MNQSDQLLPKIKAVLPARPQNTSSFPLSKVPKYREGDQLSRRVFKKLDELLTANNKLAADGKKSVSSETQRSRKVDMYQFFKILPKVGYKIQSVYSLKPKHINAVFAHLESQGAEISTLEGKVSSMRFLCNWIEKGDMIDNCEFVKYLSKKKREASTNNMKSASQDLSDLRDKLPEIAKLDEVVAIWVELCIEFGLTLKQSIGFRPHVNVAGISVWTRGATKSEKPGLGLIKTDAQRKLIEKAKVLADNKFGLLGKIGNSYEQNRNRVNYVLKKCGASIKGVALNEKDITGDDLIHDDNNPNENSGETE